MRRQPGEEEMANIYIDGESHYIRSEQCWKSKHGENADLGDATHKGTSAGQVATVHIQKARFFWDNLIHINHAKVGLRSKAEKLVYFTSLAGDDDEVHSIRVQIRGHGFEPLVLKEPVTLANRRKLVLTRDLLLEKPKGVDISLAVRVLEDAYRGIFQECAIATSDVDFLPVIRAVQALGKRVVVLGYRSGLGKNSDLDYVPDHFYDLSIWMNEFYDIVKPPLKHD
jgi:uncharacterized LabA/DUF88 family protein